MRGIPFVIMLLLVAGRQEGGTICDRRRRQPQWRKTRAQGRRPGEQERRHGECENASRHHVAPCHGSVRVHGMTSSPKDGRVARLTCWRPAVVAIFMTRRMTPYGRSEE